MRNLTIRRTKSFVASLIKEKVCIEDPASGELLINNIPCRVIGILKNGEEKTFPIDEESRKVFVIADNLSKSYCNDFYEIPAGNSDIVLSGKNKFNLANGNAFRFDNNESQAVLANRKKANRKGLLVLCIAIVVGLLIGAFLILNLFSGKAAVDKTFSSNGMNITLTSNFRETAVDGFTACYDSRKVAIFALKEEFSLMPGSEEYTLAQYMDLVIEGNNLTSAKFTEISGLKGFEYDFNNPQTNDTYHYITFVYKSDDAFWMIQFACLAEDSENYYETIVKWANSVHFSN